MTANSLEYDLLALGELHSHGSSEMQVEFLGRRRGSVGVLPPVMVQAVEGAFPGHSQLFLCVY